MGGLIGVHGAIVVAEATNLPFIPMCCDIPAWCSRCLCIMSKDVFVCCLLLQDGTSWCRLCVACALPVHCGAVLKLVFVCDRKMMQPYDHRRADLLQRQEACEECGSICHDTSRMLARNDAGLGCCISSPWRV